MAGKVYFLFSGWTLMNLTFIFFLRLKLKSINRNLESLTQVEFLYESCCALLKEKILFPDILLPDWSFSESLVLEGCIGNTYIFWLSPYSLEVWEIKVVFPGSHWVLSKNSHHKAWFPWRRCLDMRLTGLPKLKTVFQGALELEFKEIPHLEM